MKLTKWNQIFKRSLSALLALVMVLGMVPWQIFMVRAEESPTLDSIAWENLTYRDIFIKNNKAYLDGFNNRTYSPFVPNTGSNTVTKEACNTAPYSLAAFGSTPQQIKSVDTLPIGNYFVASKVYCTRYVKGKLGVCLHSTTVGITEVTDGFVTASGIIASQTAGKVYIGSIHSADLDGYVDDPVVVDMSIFTTRPTEAELTALYETYVDLEKAIEREEVLHTEQEMLDAFVDYMNRKAASIGMTNSDFSDPIGMDNRSKTSDLLRLIVYAYANYDELGAIWGDRSHVVTIGGARTATRTVNSTVIKPALEDYYHILGGKTGTLTAHNARNLAVILEIPNSEDRLAVVAMYANGMDSDGENRFEAVRQIADAALIKYADPDADISDMDVCCAGAAACLIPAEGVDMENLQILYTKDADTQRVPASITKVLAAICALDCIDSMADTGTYSAFDTQIGSFYTKDFLPGDTVTFEDALHAMLLPSSNVTARMVAREAGGILLASANGHTHTYTPTVTAPSCTEQGYTTYTCECGDSYVDDYVDATGHTYENGICTGCGAEHPNLANYKGKVISILGGSNCTFAGYVPTADGFNLEHRTRYPQDNLLTDVSDTWWMQLIAGMNAKLGINDSWAGSQVLNTQDTNSGDLGPDAAMASLTRIQNLGANGTPDVILFFGGCNDIGRSVNLGSFDPATAPTQADLTATKWDSFADAYVAAILRMRHYYPDARILAMLPYNSPTYFTASKVEKYGAVIRAICDHYGIACVDLRDSGIQSSHLPDNIHPNAAGSDYITTAVMDALLSGIELEAGEHIVYPVTHELTGARSSLSYYKGVSAGKPFDTIITGDDVTVTVTMGGMDITGQVYAQGRIRIPAVTGEVVITARGEYNADGRLQQLPEQVCCGTNLWAALDPVNEYYTGTGWGNNSNSNYSVTFPVTVGEQLWATSFGAAGTNGYSANGVRITWFTGSGVLESLGRDAVYAEFAENGYITVPEEATAVNIPMKSNAETWEIYILSRDHGYENGICTGCGAEDPNAATESLSLRYDDHYDVTGKTVEIMDAGEEVLAVEGNYLVATGIGQGKVRIDGTLYEVTVEKAKISIVVIMGQSNAGNHFENATSDVACALGTAYWWKDGATEPVDYTQPSMGFHTPLIAELYAQSVAAGDPVKPVMVWQEGVTSKNGQSIVKWAASETDTSGTDGTAAMIQNCIAYYEKNSDLYEIANCGVYWLQGESDVAMAPDRYTGLFMAMWEKLKNAGAEYLAFFRVRCGTTGNTSEHHDLGYTGSLTAQLQMINDNADMFMASTITESWEGNETTEHSVDIRNYLTLMEKYGQENSHNDAYGNAATFEDGILTTTMKTLYGSNNKCHYGKFGYGIIGADAAYNMYHALHTDEFSIVQTDTSGKADAAATSKPGDAVTIDITEMTENLAFRASCGSAAGTLAIKVESGNEDITEKVIANETNTYGTVDTEILREYDNVVITVMYNPVFGTSGSIVYSIVDNSPESPKMYFWDFENDLNARDENGEVVNSFGETALNGSYVIENGMLKGNSLQLALGKQLKLCGDENWSIEWKFGEVTANTTGFLLCNTAKSAIGTKAVYFSIVGNVMVSDYKNSKGYYNYFTEETTFASGDCIKITNTYDSENGKSVLSLWKNGKLIVSDLQKKGYINSSTYGTYDMSTYPLSGDFVFNYLGCTGLQYFPVTGEIDYLKIIPEEENAESLSLRYDDHYDVTGKTVEILDAGKPTSYQVGYGVEENAVPDTAVVTLEGDTLVATGIGTAQVKIDGQLYTVTVEAAPISLLLLIGQSNMRGSEGNANQSIVCPEGMVYATYGDDRGADNTAMTVSNAAHFAPSALTGEYSNINAAGTTDCLSGYPVYSLTEDGAGKIGPDSGFAYEWVKQTGEKVWVVNAAHGGTSINVWQPGTTEYEQCQALFTACQETLRKEIAAGHFTLSHMAYFWCQGCSDRTQSAQWYVNKYLAMHNGLKTEMSFDHDSNADTADKTFEFGGIIPVRVGSTAACYRDGVYSVSNPYAYHESFVDLRFSGPRVAQYWMINNPELSDIWGVCDIGDDWVWMPDGTNGVSAYFQAHYPNGTVDYTTQVKQSASWYTPTTPAAVHDSIHYNQIGYNEYGREAVRNALIMLGQIQAPEVTATVKLLSWDGYTEATEITASATGHSGTLVVPKVYPIWKSKEITYELTEGLTWECYDLLAADVQTEGTLTAGGKTVHVTKAEPGSHYAEHLSQLPEEICCGLNLWNVLPHDPYFYSNGTHWGIHSSGNVCSVTIPVNPGDRIFATAFGKAGENGHASSNGIRVTFFSEYGVAKTTDPAGTYKEYVANGGYLIVPEGATAANIPMWTSDNSNELYILNRSHDTANGICGICGKDSHIHSWSDWTMKEIPGKGESVTEERTCSGCGETETREVESVWQKYDLAEHYSDLPENVCSGLNLWNVLAHDRYYFASGTNWALYSSGDVCSVTIPVNPGDRIFATAFGKAGENGHATSNGIRVTFFSAYGVAKTLAPADCYGEFSANGGCLVAPENAIAINVAMWNGSDVNELYILNRDHTYENGICTGCGKAELDFAEGWAFVPISTEENSMHVAYKIEAGVLRFHDFSDASADGYGRMPDYTNSTAPEANYGIAPWYQQRNGITKVIFDETISYIGSYTLTNMNDITEIHIQNPTASVAKNLCLFSTTLREEPLSIYAASTVKTVESWIRSRGAKPISEAIVSVSLYFTDLDHLVPQFKALEESLNAGGGMDAETWYRALTVLDLIPQHNYSLSDYRCVLSGTEEIAEVLRQMRSGTCGDGLTYELATMAEEGKLSLTISGAGDMTDYADPAQAPWREVMDGISDVYIGENVAWVDGSVLPPKAVYHARLNSAAYTFAKSNNLKIQIDTIRVLCIGNSHTADYSQFLSNILADLEAAGLQTDIVIDRSIIGSIGLFSGRNSNVNATHRSHLEAIRNQAGAYSNLKKYRYDLIIIQDYLESVVDTPDMFTAGLATFIEEIKTVASENGNGEPQIAWFADWVDERTTGVDKSLYDGNGNKITLDVMSREAVYAKSLASIAAVENAIGQDAANMPDFVIHTSTIKQNAMSSYLGATKMWDKPSCCLLERDTTHLSYELGRYLIGAGVMHEIVTHYGDALATDADGVDVVLALTLDNGPVASGSGCQYEGSINEDILAIIREAISSPNVFRQSVYVKDPVETILAEIADTEWDMDGVTDQASAKAALTAQISAAFGEMLDAFAVEVSEYVDEDHYCATVSATYGYSRAERKIENRTHTYTPTVTAPTCTEQGYTTYTCTLCGDSYVADYVDALGHSYENGSCTLCGAEDPDHHIPGDINGDGDVNNKDLTRLFKHLSGYTVEVVERALDVNGDGSVNNKDLTRLFRYLSGYDVEIH